MTEQTQETVSTSHFSGQAPFRWMESSINPADNGTYTVVYNVCGQPVKSTARYDGNGHWTHKIQGFAPLFAYWLMIADIGVPSFEAPVAEEAEGPGTPRHVGTTLRAMVDAAVASEDFVEEWLNDGQVVVFLQILNNTNPEDTLSLIGALDRRNAYTNLNTPEGIEAAKVWLARVLGDLEKRGFVQVQDSSDINIAMTFTGMDVAQNGIDTVSASVAIN